MLFRANDNPSLMDRTGDPSERVLSVSPERISQMESELAGGGSAETGSLEVGLQALKDFGFRVD